VQTCSECGRANRADSRFCDGCGTSLSAPAVERRKLVTSVFCDLSGSTAMGEASDAETVFEVMRAYFDTARSALERHGGAVEKFIGDAVVGMFGVPEAHEDDALRACRAALEIQEQMRGLDLGVSVRIGVNTGEVVAGDAARREMFASGDAVVLGDSVNVAARLEQAAQPGEALIGEETYRLVRDAVEVAPVAPIAAKGKSEPLTAYRLLEVSAHGPLPRQAGTPLVGRGAELALLEAEFVASVDSCRLVTVVGEAGVGKSRLTAELAARIGDRAGIVRGACLSYGEGITYWAIAQIIHDLAGIRDDDTAEEARARVSPRIGQLLGLTEGMLAPEQIAEAIAELVTEAAREQPLVLLVDDIHWAEPALLDLLGRLPELIDAPVLVLCLARPELLDDRPDWPVTIGVGPLGAPEIDELLESLHAPAETRVRLAHAAAGNPLYAEELVAWVREGGDVNDLPTSLNALLGARLDRLESGERDALERGAVEGELFHKGAVDELSGRAVGAELTQLSRKDMIRIAAASLAGEMIAYRFKHILVRDAAYRATTKKLRATLHERYADWLEQRAGDRVGEYHEILGYHLETAYHYRTELGSADPALAARAARHLYAGGNRAMARGDYRASAILAERAHVLVPADNELLRFHAHAINQLGRKAEARALFAEVDERASAAGDRALAARARISLVGSRLWGDAETDLDAELAIVEEGLAIAEELQDERLIAEHLLQRGTILRRQGRVKEAAVWTERALVHAERAGDVFAHRAVVRALVNILVYGPTPVPEAIVRCEQLYESSRDQKLLSALTSNSLSALHAMAARFEEAERYARLAEPVVGKVDTMFSALEQGKLAEARELAGDLAGAEQAEKAKWLFFGGATDAPPDGRAVDAATKIARLCCETGRWEEAEEWMARYRGVRREVENDRLAVEARLAACHGNFQEALDFGQRAVERAERNGNLNRQAEAWLALAEAQRAAGRAEEAEASTAEALALYEQKGNVAAAVRVRAGVLA
jgi:class 3 adenylate cyclase/tetratricopeptide (TPR) repeat protein